MIQLQLSLRPFKVTWVNIVDSLLLGTILAFLLGVFFFKNEEESTTIKIVQSLYFITVIVFGYAVIVGLLSCHFIKKLKSWHSMRKKAKEVTQTEVSLNDLADENLQETYRRVARTGSVQVMEANPTRSSFTLFLRRTLVRRREENCNTRYRESILDEDN